MTKLCARGKAAAKRKFKIYPSAYANAYASKICAGKIKDPSGKKKKDWGPKKAFLGGLMKTKDKKKEEIKKQETVFDKAKKDKKTKQQRLEEMKKELGMNKGGGADMSKVKTKKKNIYKKTGDPVIDRLMFLPKILDKVSEKIAPMLGYEKKMNKGGYFDEQKTNIKGKNKTGPMPGGKTPQIPGGEYMKYKKLKKNKVISAKVGMNVTAGGESAMGRLQKSGMLKAYTGRAVRQPTETNKEFEMRHEYHTPFGKPEKARGGGIAIKGTNFKGVF